MLVASPLLRSGPVLRRSGGDSSDVLTRSLSSCCLLPPSTGLHRSGTKWGGLTKQTWWLIHTPVLSSLELSLACPLAWLTPERQLSCGGCTTCSLSYLYHPWGHPTHTALSADVSLLSWVIQTCLHRSSMHGTPLGPSLSADSLWGKPTGSLQLRCLHRAHVIFGYFLPLVLHQPPSCWRPSLLLSAFTLPSPASPASFPSSNFSNQSMGNPNPRSSKNYPWHFSDTTHVSEPLQASSERGPRIPVSPSCKQKPPNPNCSVTASYTRLRGEIRTDPFSPQKKENEMPWHFHPYKYTSEQAALCPAISYTQSCTSSTSTSQEAPGRVALVLVRRATGDSITLYPPLWEFSRPKKKALIP